METLRFDLSKKGNAIKILSATNGGPFGKRWSPDDQTRSNFEAYKAAKFPYSRNHDTNAIIGAYGGPFSHDITAIFPNFDADENDPASYDFACTDESILYTLEAGTKTFFRLGQTIEHQVKKHDTLPPKDFSKWARICEHIIMHYNEGWANGYRLNMQYWEIWNEPDMAADDAEDIYRLTWGGTKARFFDFFEIAAKHLKSKFPHLKIGGPALCGNEDWAKDFLSEMHKRNVALDFFSWHIYCVEPKDMIEKAERIRAMLDKNGYEKTESILNEWNYIRGWSKDYVPSLLTIHGMKGAAFTMACISAAQPSTIDMLMYYDTRPGLFNGAFDYYSLNTLKGYYPFKWYGEFYDLQAEIPCETKSENIYTICGKAKDGKTLTIVTFYTDRETEASEKTVGIDFGKEKKGKKYEVYLLDETHDGELVSTTDDLTFTMKPNTCMLLKEI